MISIVCPTLGRFDEPENPAYASPTGGQHPGRSHTRKRRRGWLGKEGEKLQKKLVPCRYQIGIIHHADLPKKCVRIHFIGWSAFLTIELHGQHKVRKFTARELLIIGQGISAAMMLVQSQATTCAYDKNVAYRSGHRYGSSQ
jgi:hypothetical protein